MDRTERRCFAKLNLALSVAPPEPAGSPREGWHRIASWMHCVALHDDLMVEHAEGASLSLVRRWADDALRPSPIDWPEEKDLVHRAHALLSLHVGRPLPARIELRKRVPVGSGMGGGSSDAAATLRALVELFELDVSVDELRELSARLGSDVAFFLDDRSPARPAIVGDFGDTIERVGPVGGSVLLLIPPFGCETRAVYRAYDELGPSALEEERVRALSEQPLMPDAPFNDLAAGAERVEPRLAELRSRLEAVGGVRVHVTGSGSSMFAIGAGEELEALAGEARSMGVETVTTSLI